MILSFEESYEVCNCKKVTIKDLVNSFNNQNARSLGDMQTLTGAGTECRYCIFEEGDFGRIKKKIYCKDILNEMKKELANG